MEFPPLTRYVEHAPFSWAGFLVLACLIAGVVAPFELRAWSARAVAGKRQLHQRRLPWWGRLGLALTLVAWILAWTRFTAFEALQPFTFSPLWFGYILVINAMTYRRTGECMLTHRPRQLLALFLLSAGFWWYFEYLNRFVQNWYYVGLQDITPFQYFVFATLPFSTVIPAVLGTYEFLRSVPRCGAGLDRALVVPVKHPVAAAWIVLVISCAGLVGIAVWPHLLFPLLWLSPLLVVTCVQAIRGERTPLAPARAGRWRDLYLLAMAALICGFFWEMWNYGSMARWIYNVPYVNRFHLFEMPVLGYAGYLPFGVECAVAAQFVGYRVPTEP